MYLAGKLEAYTPHIYISVSKTCSYSASANMNKLELDDLLDSEISDDEVGDTEDINEERY